MRIKNTFIQGKLNKDIDERLLVNGQYPHAENVRVSNSEASDIGAVENMLGNRALTTLDLGANPSTIFQVKNNFSDTIYWGVRSDRGSYVIEYNTNTDTVAFVLRDERVGDANVLNFNRDFLITDPRILVDSDNNRTFLFLSDNNSFIKQINIERAKTYALNGFSEADISLIKTPPLNPPTIALSNTTSRIENNIEERFLMFSYRYRYLDGEYSSFAPFSEVAFRPRQFSYDFSINSNDSMVNAFNEVDITINTGSNLVTSVDIIFKEATNSIPFLVGSFDKEDQGWSDDVEETVNFTNSKVARQLPVAQLNRLFDNVPRKAKGLELIGNRLILGNYTENYNLLDSDGNEVIVDLTLDNVQTDILLGTGTPTMKSIRDYEAVIAYGDEYGRLTTALESEGNSTHVSGSNSTKQNELALTIANNPPEWASFYRIYVKQSRANYDVITPTTFYQEGSFVWVKIENSDVSKIAENDVVYVKSDTRGLLNDVIEVKILEIREQPRNFLELEETTNLEQVAGTYARMRPVGFQLFEADLDRYEFAARYSNTDFENYIGNNINAIQNPAYYGVSGGLNDMVTTGSYTGNVDTRFLIEIDSTERQSSGTINLTSGVSGDEIISITVDGVEILSGAVSFNTDRDTTAADVAANINAFTSTPNYTATSDGAVITITSVDEGSSTVGLAIAVTGDINVITANLSGGDINTFRWSTDNGATFGGENIPIPDGVPADLENGVQVRFGSTMGHLTTDRWFFGAKAAADDRFGFNEDAFFYAIYRGNPDDDAIRAGSRINITYNEYDDEIQFVQRSFVSTANYDNLEEWFIGDNIINDFGGIPESRIWFRRGNVTQVRREEWQLNMTPDRTGSMNMIIRSLGEETNNADDDAIATVNIEIIQSETTVIFETKPVEIEDESYYEVSRTYPIVNGFHTSTADGDVSQTASQDAVLRLPLFNAYAWGNGFESIKIRDAFNAPRTSITTRPLAAIEDYRENIRIASLTYSGVYNQTTNFNAINEFNLSTANFKDMDDVYGSIQKLWSRDTNLIVFQEDKTHYVLFQKDIIFNADGTGNVSQNNNVLGQEVPYLGEYGISLNPESFAIYGNFIWHTDTRRGCVLQLTNNGYHEISDNGMRDYFRDYFRNNLTARKYGMYDPYHDQYVLGLRGEDQTVTYDPKNEIKGWTSFHSFIPDGMVELNNRFYTIKNGQLYLHNDETAPRNTYYGTAYPSRISLLVNAEPSTIKELHAISFEGSEPWDVDLRSYITTVGDFKRTDLAVANFVEKEGLWFAYVRRNEETNYESKAAYGIGVVTAINGNVLTINGGSTLLTTNDQIFNTTPAAVGSIQTIVRDGSTTTLTLDAVANINVGDYVFGMKDNRIEGGNLRGYTMRYDLTNNTTNRAVELYAVNSEVKKSYTS